MFAIRTFFCLLLITFLNTSCGKPEADETSTAPPPSSSDQVAVGDPHAGHDHAAHAGHDHAVHGKDPHAGADHFVVKVNGKELKHDELNSMVQQVAGSQLGRLPEQKRGQFMQQMMPKFQQEAVERFIAVTVLIGEADWQKIVATDAEVGEMIANLREQIPPTMKWEDALKRMNTTDTEIRRQMAVDIKIRNLLKARTESLPKATAAEIKKVYDDDLKRFSQTAKAGARHVLIKVDAGDDAAAKEIKLDQIKTLRKKIIDGADFAEIAKAYSDCPSKSKGGDLGEFGPGQMVKPFSDAAFAQELNKVGEVVTTRFGYHIIEVTSRTDAKQLSFAEAEKKIADELSQKGDQEAVDTFIKALRAKAEISYGEGHAPAPTPPAAAVPGQPPSK